LLGNILVKPVIGKFKRQSGRALMVVARIGDIVINVYRGNMNVFPEFEISYRLQDGIRG